MFWHVRELRFVRYGRVEPPSESAVDAGLREAYRWLGSRCGYAPQLWLTRARRRLTTSRTSSPRRRQRLVAFGFEGIQGFPVAFEPWCLAIEALADPTCRDLAHEERLRIYLDEAAAEAAAQAEEDYEEHEDEWRALLAAWRAQPDLEAWLAGHLFREHDQVVLPALNLKAAKEIVVRSERDKSELRRLGFYEDRIEVRKLRCLEA